MRVATFNANGIRAAARKGFWTWFSQQSIDVLCLQELKADQSVLQDLDWPTGYHVHTFPAEQAGYSGVAILSKQAPESITCIMDEPVIANEGRILLAKWPSLCIASMYLPSGTSGDARQAIKMQILDWLEHVYLPSLWHDDHPILLCGDFNIAHRQIDLKNWRGNQKNSGFLPEERAWMDRLLNSGWRDTHRHLLGDDIAYTWWSYRNNARKTNAGWRLDYQISNSQAQNSAKRSFVETQSVFSDHAPLVIDYEFSSLDD